MKKTIVHVIFDLTRGGAETMLVRVIKELTEYDHVVVTLYKKNHFGAELECKKLVCLNLTSILQLPLAVVQLKIIVKEHNPVLVHSHLIWPTMVARLATPKKIPLFTTIHTSVASAVDYKRWWIKGLDKLTYKYRKSIIIAVSKCAYNDYFSFLKVKLHKAYVLYTFVDTSKFKAKQNTNQNNEITKVITVGALRHAKNYFYLLNAFTKIKNYPIELDVYGTGVLEQELKEKLSQLDINVNLKGEIKNIQTVIDNYNIFVMASSFEGFSLSVLEAMTMEIPMLLSNIPSFKEQCGNNAIYFNLDNEDDFVSQLHFLINNKKLQQQMVANAKNSVINNYTLQHHIDNLRAIYTEGLQNGN
jgi:glycosyltransferase involved in cell wall biosynthesis